MANEKREGKDVVEDFEQIKRKAMLKVEVDKGWAWIVCFCVFLATFITGGTMKLSGVLFAEYEELFMQSAVSTSFVTVTWSISLTLISPLGGYLADTLSLKSMRILMFVMYIIASVTVGAAGFMPNLPLTILVYGVLSGASFTLVHARLLSLPSLYFNKKRTTAYGILFAGASLGGLGLPPLFAISVSSFGFRGAMLILSGIWLHTLFVPCVSWPLNTEKDIIQSKQGNSNIPTVSEQIEMQSEPSIVIITDHEADNDSSQHLCHVFKNIGAFFKSYIRFMKITKMPLLISVVMVGQFAFYNHFFVIPVLTKEMSIDKIITSVMLSVFSAVDLVSEFVVGIIVDKFRISKWKILLATNLLSGVAGLAVSFFLNMYVLFAYVIFLGITGGATIVLSIPMMVDLAGQEQKGVASGVFSLISGFTTALGPLILGGVGEALGSYVHSLRALAVGFLLTMVLCVLSLMRMCSCRKGSFNITPPETVAVGKDQ